MTEAVKAWKPESVGIYLAPELFENSEALESTLNTLVVFLKDSVSSNYYLFSGNHGMNAVLNIALRLKDLTENEEMRVSIWH